MSAGKTAAGRSPEGDGDAQAGALLGIDVGGTFTDAVLISGGAIFSAKVPTTADQADGVLEAARRVMELADIDGGGVDYFAHGMTTATNALLERKGARTAAVTTEGFRDILEIGRQNRPRLYDLCPQRPEPLVPRELRFTARERVAPQGVVEPLLPEEIARVVAELQAAAPEAVAVCLLFSFLDPSHERALAGAIEAALAGVHVSISSSVLPQFREYERFSTTAVDACLTPVVASYLTSLEGRCRAAGLPEPAIMQSNGGVLPLGEAAGRAAPLLLSGPAAGVVGAMFAGERVGYVKAEGLLALDMGGTSTDVTLVRHGAAMTTTERVIGGQPVALPMVDIHTIGAGGGSIAWIDPGGALRVGPKSAGAEPGPACYGRGGTEATVTDANICLGYLGGQLGGEDGIVLDRAAAEAAVGRLASAMGMGLEETAMGIRRVVEAEMLKALRVITVERGHDPRDYTLLVFGGAGPMHAVELADELGMHSVVIPDSCGVLSALGMVVGDERRDWVKTVYTGGDWSTATLKAAFTQLEEEKRAEIQGAIIRRGVDMRYRGQSHELTITADGGLTRENLEAEFARAHKRAYGYLVEGEEAELVSIRLTALRQRQQPDFGRPEPPAAQEGAGADVKWGERRAWFWGAWQATHVVTRKDLWFPGGTAVMEGPLIIEDEEATTVVPPGQEVLMDNAGNLIVSRWHTKVT